jgi:flagellar motility protein MotE (MotC chaperone)
MRTPGAKLAVPTLLMTGAIAGLLGVFVSPAAAQDWTPTVATVPGGTLHDPIPGAMNRAPTHIDPRYFPAPRSTAPRTRPVPQGAWSPMVTGALPQPGGQAQAHAPVPRPTPAGSAVVPPLDATLSPVRPTAPQAVAAAGVKAEDAGGPSPSPVEDDEGEPLFKKPGPLDALPPNATPAQQYCFNTADSAADARFAWQAKKIQDMEAELDKKAQQLEAKTEEYKRWLERRDEFARKAHEKLVGFYTRMRADAAALQLATLDEEMAAAVVMKLQTKVASQIMGEMDPERAAKIASIISGAGKIPTDKRRAAVSEAAPPADNAGTPAEVPR